MVNGALLTEEGFEYNSVDPIGLATLAGKCLGIGDRPSAINSYNVSSNSEDGPAGRAIQRLRRRATRSMPTPWSTGPTKT